MTTETRRTIEIIVAVLFLTLIPVGIFVHKYNYLPSGYLVPYLGLELLVLLLLVSILSAILTAIPQTRPVGLGVALFFIPCAIFVGVKVSDVAGFTLWRHRPMVRIGPDITASVVVYYKLGTTKPERDEVENSVIFQPRTDNHRMELKSGIREYVALRPSQAHGHFGIALVFSPSMPQAQRDSIISSFRQSQYVLNAWTDISPQSVPDPEPTPPQSKH